MWILTICIALSIFLFPFEMSSTYYNIVWKVTIYGYMIFALFRILIDSCYYVKELKSTKLDYFTILLPGLYGCLLVVSESYGINNILYNIVFWIICYLLLLVEFMFILTKPSITQEK